MKMHSWSNTSQNSEMVKPNRFMDQDYFNGRLDKDPPKDYGTKEDYDDDASLDSEGKQKSFTRLCVRFAEKTSMQGLPYINAAKLWYAKVLWVLLLLGGIAGMTLHLYFLIDQYLQFDVQVSVTLGFNNLHFPAVTICNVNAVKKSETNTLSQQLQSFIETTDPSNITPKAPGQPTGRRKRGIEEYSNINYDNYSKEFDFRPNRGTKDNNQRIQDTFETLYMQEPRLKRRRAGHQMNDMLLQCSLGGYECYPWNFTLIQSEKYGNCYTIQSDNFIVTNPGPESGLSMVLYMENEEYLTGISHGYGARVQIHDRNTYPFPADEGLFVPSSFETHIGLKQVEIIRQGGLYGDCTNTSSYLHTYGARYTRTLCQVFCEQTLVVEQCSCYDIAKSDIFKTLNTSLPDKACRTDIERECLAQFDADRLEATLNCPQCTNPCNEDQYVKSFSSRNWPNNEYANVLMQSVCEKLPQDKCSRITGYSNDKYSLGKNFVKVVVYYEDLNFEKVEETPEIEVQQFASDVGGAIGLWIGLSIISVFELVQLLLECCAFGVHKCKNPPSSKRKRREKYREPPKDTQKRQTNTGHKSENSFQLN